MKRKKLGRNLLIAGILCLLMALALIFLVDSSPLALFTLLLSIFINTTGICLLTWK